MKFYLPTNKQKIELDIKLLKNIIGIENLETIANSNPGFIYVPAELIATIKQIFHSISLTFHASSSKTIRHQFTNRMFPKKFKIQNYLESSNLYQKVLHSTKLDIFVPEFFQLYPKILY